MNQRHRDEALREQQAHWVVDDTQRQECAIERPVHTHNDHPAEVADQNTDHQRRRNAGIEHQGFAAAGLRHVPGDRVGDDEAGGGDEGGGDETAGKRAEIERIGQYRPVLIDGVAKAVGRSRLRGPEAHHDHLDIRQDEEDEQQQDGGECERQARNPVLHGAISGISQARSTSTATVMCSPCGSARSAGAPRRTHVPSVRTISQC